MSQSCSRCGVELGPYSPGAETTADGRLLCASCSARSRWPSPPSTPSPQPARDARTHRPALPTPNAPRADSSTPRPEESSSTTLLIVFAVLAVAVVLGGIGVAAAAGVVFYATHRAEERVGDSEEEPDDDSGSVPRDRRWVGTGTQSDGQTWPIELTVHGHRERPCASVDYASDDAPCTAEWHCDSHSTRDRLIATERVRSGHSSCIDGCRVVADLKEGQISFDCSREQVSATATIHRSD